VSPLRVYPVAKVGYVIGRLAGRKLVFEPEDVFPTRAEADQALKERNKKVKGQ
jgi:hypothetical protein